MISVKPLTNCHRLDRHIIHIAVDEMVLSIEKGNV